MKPAASRAISNGSGQVGFSTALARTLYTQPLGGNIFHVGRTKRETAYQHLYARDLFRDESSQITFWIFEEDEVDTIDPGDQLS
jgi:hypothetical protein